MTSQRGVVTSLTALLVGFAFSVEATECTYRLSRDFRNIQSNVFRHNATAGDIIELLFETEETLVRNDTKTNTIEPGLAKSWEYDAQSQRLIFTLNKNCYWSDGSPLIADDFVYGFRELYNHGVLPNIGGNLIVGAEDIIEKGAPLETLQVNAHNDNKVSVGIVGDPNIALLYLTYVSYSPLPSHVLNAEHVPLASPRRRTIGPFRVQSMAKDIIVLGKNPHYCSDQKIDIDRIELVNRKEGYWEFSELMAGRLDMIRYSPEKQLQILQTNNDEKTVARVEYIDEKRQTYLLLNPLHSGFSNPEIRHKLASAIDYDSLVYRGNSFSRARRVAKTLFYDLPNYQNYAYSEKTNSYQKGIKDLRRTMEKYGYSNNNRFKASITTYPLERFEVGAKMVASMLRQAHFDITLVKTQSVSEAVKHAGAGRYEMFFQSWYLDYSDPQSSLDGMLHSLGFLINEENSLMVSKELEEHFIQPFNKRLLQLKQAGNQADRFNTLHLIEGLIGNSGLAIPLYTEHSAIVVSSRISALDGQFPHSRMLTLNGCSETEIMQKEGRNKKPPTFH